MLRLSTVARLGSVSTGDFDMGCGASLESGLSAHLPRSVGGKLCCFQETPRLFDMDDRLDYAIGDGEFGLEGGDHRITNLSWARAARITLRLAVKT